MSIKSYNIDPTTLFSLVPNGNVKILLWKDNWCGDMPLQDKFPHLYNLESVKRCSLMDRLCNIGFSWKWRMKTMNTEALIELHEFYKLVGSINFDSPSKFGLCFKPSMDGMYVVSTLRRSVDSYLNQISGPMISWSKVIPLKFKCFVWRAAMDKIPISEALIHRGIDVNFLRWFTTGYFDGARFNKCN